MLVVEKKWLSEEEFLSALTMCRVLPGANQVNMAVFVGTKMRGIPGASSRWWGCACCRWCSSLAMAFVYFRFKEVPRSRACCTGPRRRRSP